MREERRLEKDWKIKEKSFLVLKKKRKNGRRLAIFCEKKGTWLETSGDRAFGWKLLNQ